jgi:uncharacterized membrane protein YraQ (UPF0718 family)
MWFFPIAVLVLYSIVFLMDSEEASQAMENSGNVLRTIAWPMALVLAAMLIINIFVQPARITKFLGKDAGLKGVFISIVAGIISVGPIYAWYPLLKDLKEKGAANSLIAIFLYNRAVKPFLLPVMIGYFGWVYVATLTVFTILGSIFVGYSTKVLVKEV